MFLLNLMMMMTMMIIIIIQQTAISNNGITNEIDIKPKAHSMNVIFRIKLTFIVLCGRLYLCRTIDIFEFYTKVIFRIIKIQRQLNKNFQLNSSKIIKIPCPLKFPKHLFLHFIPPRHLFLYLFPKTRLWRVVNNHPNQPTTNM